MQSSPRTPWGRWLICSYLLHWCTYVNALLFRLTLTISANLRLTQQEMNPTRTECQSPELLTQGKGVLSMGSLHGKDSLTDLPRSFSSEQIPSHNMLQCLEMGRHWRILASSDFRQVSTHSGSVYPGQALSHGPCLLRAACMEGARKQDLKCTDFRMEQQAP